MIQGPHLASVTGAILGDEGGDVMVAAPIEIEVPVPDERFPWQPPYTVDTLFELPTEDGLRYEVLGGSLVVSPQPTPGHNLIADRLGRMLAPSLPLACETITNSALRLPNGDGPVPDLMVVSGDPFEHRKGMPVDLVHTIVEVVSPSNARTDRIVKTEMYAEAGIPCYWRIEQRPWKEHFGPVPAIVVRLRDKDGQWQQFIAPAGLTAALPVAVDHEGTVVTVEIDPAVLVGKRGG
jgi:Uma2 family endonuclease